MWWAWVVLLALVTGCTSTWKTHEINLAEAQRLDDLAAAKGEADWLIDNAFAEAPAEQRGTEQEADRYLLLADITTKMGENTQAIDALRQALMIDPTCADSVRKKLGRLQLSPHERQRVKEEFAWNMAVLNPEGGDVAEPSHCWSYRVRQIRIRRNAIVSTDRGREHQVTYDARPWRFDAESAAWHAEGDWMTDAGSESELVGGPRSGRYRAIVAADHAFYADGQVPECHRSAWSGPYVGGDTAFVATKLPQADVPN